MNGVNGTGYRIYLASGMRGHYLKNFPAFDEARDAFKAAGWDVVSPADLDREQGFNEHTLDEEMTNADLRFIFANDFHALCFCDAIATLLPHWPHSSGAKVELMIACLLDIDQIIYTPGMKVPTPEEFYASRSNTRSA
jgi:hypothetical protein